MKPLTLLSVGAVAVASYYLGRTRCPTHPVKLWIGYCAGQVTVQQLGPYHPPVIAQF